MAAFPVSVSRRQNSCARALTGKAAVPAARRRVGQRERHDGRALWNGREGDGRPQEARLLADIPLHDVIAPFRVAGA